MNLKFLQIRNSQIIMMAKTFTESPEMKSCAYNLLKIQFTFRQNLISILIFLENR